MSQETIVSNDVMAKLKAWNNKLPYSVPHANVMLSVQRRLHSVLAFIKLVMTSSKSPIMTAHIIGIPIVERINTFVYLVERVLFTQRIDYYSAHVKKDRMMLLKTKVESLPQLMQVKSATMIKGTAGLMNLTINKLMNIPSV